MNPDQLGGLVSSSLPVLKHINYFNSALISHIQQTSIVNCNDKGSDLEVEFMIGDTISDILMSVCRSCKW